MRIQHNIMAINAYRNYTNNVSAMKSNLEKLSSGYKINRAGDDAAGLAISEKMRAQITGLETAQKNAKDGISLVQTAEGALTEVHDMLNRMVELATQSANGTYDNDTDRFQLQKEMDQLNSEIDRIADSANFNGIKLLNGSLSADGVADVNGTFGLPSVGDKLGVNTILHKGGSAADEAAYFTVQLHDVAFDDNSANTFSLKIGDEAFTLAGADGGTALTASDIAQKFLDGDFKVTSTGVAVDKDAIELNGNTYTAEKVEIGNGEFGIKFTQTDVGKAADIDFDVKVSGKASNPSWTTGAYTAATAPTDGAGADDGTDQSATAATWNNDAAVSIKLKIDGKTYTFSKNDIAGAADAAAMKTAIGAATAQIDGADEALSTYVDVTEDAGVFTLKVKDAFADKATVTGFSYTQDTGTAGTGGPKGANGSGTAGTNGTKASFANNGSATATDGGVTGDWNVTVTDKFAGKVAGDNRLASTVITMKSSMFKDGASVTIGGTDYTFTTDKTKKDNADTVYIGDLDMSKTDDVKKAINRLTDVADTNEVYTVGYNGNDKLEVTLTENVGYYDEDDASKYDLTKLSEIERSLGYKVPGSDGKALTLQIGDTADDYNQLKVNIKDMHAASLGLDKIKISDQTSAATAVDVIKKAINTVSDVRGTLGATQNRLDHTINNLSVMTENIQDAESTIRDVDVAEEMMAYTKNNILIQSAQAMLAQANQVPQGVLQLLQ